MSATQRRGGRVAVVAALLACASCSDGSGPVTTVRPDLVLPEALDFGELPLGTSRTLDLELVNAGDGALVIEDFAPDPDASTDLHRFEWTRAGITVPPGATHRLQVRFTPLAPQEQSVQSGLTIVSNLQDAHVALLGRGVASRIEVRPEVLDFGAVLWGSERRLQVVLTNRHDVPAELFVPLDGQGRPRVETIDGAGRFELLSVADRTRGGALLGAGETLAPGEAFEAALSYVATPGDNRVVDQGRWWIATCAPAACALAVPLRARPRPDAFECSPELVDFGRVEPDEQVVRTATCTNVVSEAVELREVRLAPGPEGFDVLDAPGEVEVAPGATFNVRVAFAPPATAVGRRLERTLTLVHRRPGEVGDDRVSELPLAGTVGRPRLEVLPDVLQFSPTALGTRAFRRLLVRNTGQGLLSVATEGSAAPFEVDVQSLSVPPGTEGELEVRFSPLAVGATRGTLTLTSNDPLRPTADVTLEGEGVLVAPCEHRLSAAALELGVVEVGRPARGTLEISNEGAGPCLLNDLRLVGADTAGFRITDARRTGRVIAVGTSTAVQVELRPTEARAYHADLELYLSSAGAERLVIPVRGEGVLVPLIVTPSELLVGPAGPGCATPRAELRLLNPSGATVRLTGARLSAPNLELEAPPDLLGGNLALAPGGSVRLTVRLRPGVVGPTQAWLQVDEAGIAAPYQVAVRVLDDTDGLRRQRFEPGPSELRVLFVVADDPQFGEEQATLPAAGRRFIDVLEAARVSYRVGVVRALATDATCPVPLTAERPTPTLVGACGYLADGGAAAGMRPEWRVVEQATLPTPQDALSATLVQSLRTTFGAPTVLATLRQALTAPLVGGWNRPLLGGSGPLAVIYATAGDDQGSYDPQSVVDLVRHAAGPGQPFTISGAAGPRSGFCNVGGLFAGPSPRLAALADAAGGLHREICDLAWIDGVVMGGLPVAGHRRRFMLDEAADPASVMVWLDGVPVPALAPGSGAEQWSLRAGAVELAAPLPPTAVLDVAYRPLCD